MNFTRVSKANPCPICKRPDWCRVFTDGWAECMRVESASRAKSGGWMHKISTAPPRYVPPVPKCPPVPAINFAALHRRWLEQTQPEARRAFADSLGLSEAAIVSVGAAWASQSAAWAFPMRDGYGEIVGIRLRNEKGKFAVKGSKQGIFIACANPAPTLYVCEGPTDTAAALDLGLFAVGRPNCCCGGLEIRVYARRVGVSRVVMVADNDKPGLDGAAKVAKEIRLPYALYMPPAKDIREFMRLGGTKVMIENTLKDTLWHK